MTAGNLLHIQPTELKFLVELRKQSSSSLRLTNNSENCVAFKVKTTNPKKYCVRPNTGIVLPGSTCSVTGPKESPPDMQCKDKFLLLSVVAPEGATVNDITSDMFNKGNGRVVEEFKLRVIYIPANPPSPVPEGSEEGTPPRSVHENGIQNATSFEAVSRSLEETKQKSSEAWSLISKLTDEKSSALQQNQRLSQELETLRKEASRAGGFSLSFVVLIGLLGALIGYLIKKV
ncbi:Major sperm protein [Corchorus olitorius]|uniref:Major sperm protein n=1 Tax=Corchorus olitorius TaxID=93759 RepID=A0A1R3K0Q6_9ROSI|nr:Major sperm protein [Corchorus olitorius]